VETLAIANANRGCDHNRAPRDGARGLPQIAHRHRREGEEDGEADFADDEGGDLAFLVVMDEGEADEHEAEGDDEHAEEEKVAGVHHDLT